MEIGKRVEKYIQDYTRNCSNELGAIESIEGTRVISYHEWLTPDQARRAVEIAREETIKEVCEWLDNHTMLSEKWYIEDLKKYLEDKK